MKIDRVSVEGRILVLLENEYERTAVWQEGVKAFNDVCVFDENEEEDIDRIAKNAKELQEQDAMFTYDVRIYLKYGWVTYLNLNIYAAQGYIKAYRRDHKLTRIRVYDRYERKYIQWRDLFEWTPESLAGEI